jgi:hypothetical protein
MLDFWKLFSREARRQALPAPPGPDSEYHPSQPGEGLEVEYHALIASEFRRLRISPACATIEVRRLGHSPGGFEMLAGMVRLHQWERRSALRLLLGLPALESRIRRAVRASWLADYSHFGGLWLHASEQVLLDPASGELRRLMRALTTGQPAAPGDGTAGAPAGEDRDSLPPSSQPSH